jgi:crotonobetainyl-CoA:carnitine CoA-transferase CaiB-like acyl-CoA transferase
MAHSTLLDGITVLDVTQVMAGPYCAMLLCDMGARVIKIEPPGGDSTRSMAGSAGTDSAAFNAVNRGKLGVVLDLQTSAGRDALRRMSRSADILVENFRPGVMAKFGLDYAALAVDNPRLIYASISGYGQTGPSASKGGFDLVAQGESGLMSITGEQGRPPVKIGVPITDLGAGLFALSAILAALYWRASSGRGQHIDTSLFEAGIALSVWEATEYFSGRIPERLGSAHRMSAPYQAFRCADGYLTVGAANQRTFEKFARLLGRDGWISDPRYSSDARRVEHRGELAEAIESIMMARSCAEWLAALDAAGIPCGRINSYAEVFSDPQVSARDMTVSVDHPTLGVLTTLGTPVKMSRTPLNAGRRAPLLGEHTAQVLADFGFTTDQIQSLLR